MQTESAEPSSSKRYATAEDWPKYQDVIVRLYVEENKTLEEVRQYMEDRHDFVATISMYKRQLASWHAYKNLRFDEVLQILRLKRQREAENSKGSVFFVRDRRVEADSLQVYISRNPSLFAKLESGEEPHLDAIRDVSCRSPSPPPSPSPSPSPSRSPKTATPKSPEQTEGFENEPENKSIDIEELMALPVIQRPLDEVLGDLMQSLQTYLSHGFGSGMWTRTESYCWSSRGYRGPAELLKSLLDRCMTAALSVGRQVEPTAVRHALDAPFSLLIRVFKNPPPEMIARILCIAARLEFVGRKEIQSILLQFCSDLAKALYGPDHSLSGFWQTLLEVQSTDRIGAIEAVLGRCVSEFERHFGPSHSLSVETYLLYFDAVERRKDPKIQAGSLQLQFDKLDDQIVDPTITAMLKLEHALANCKLDLQESQLDKAEDALSRLDVSTLPPRDDSFRCVWLGYVRWIKGDTAAAENAYKDSVMAAKRTGSRDCVCEALYQLETFYLHTREPLKAEGIRAERLDIMRSLGTVVWTDGSYGTASSTRDIETGSDINIIRIGSDASIEMWSPSATNLMIGHHELCDHVTNNTEGP
ncbi:hypothetical protein GGS20DRAFT_170737 [Poronia punctata]|nr:hypothetical protein GGS20DRAFT_170737 [Poronia punctata]